MILATDIPQYDTSILGFFGQSGWTPAEWVEWHKALVASYSKTDADIKWATAWLDGISVGGGGNGKAPGSGLIFDSVPVGARSFDSYFREYLNQSGNDILKAAVFSGVFGSTVGVTVSTTLGTFDKGLNVINNLASGAEKASKVAEYAIPAVLVLASITLAVVVISKGNEQTKAAA